MVMGTKCPSCGAQSCTIPCNACRDAGRSFFSPKVEEERSDEPPTVEEFQKDIDGFLAERSNLTWVVFPGNGKNHVAAFEFEQDAREFADKKGYMAIHFAPRMNDGTD